MTATLRNEFAKMRRLHMIPLLAVLLGGVLALVIFSSLSSGLTAHAGDPDGYGWKVLFAALSTGAALIAPLLLAVMASRQVEVEHTGRGWLAWATAGMTPGHLCRAKFAALALPVAGATVTWAVCLTAFGAFAGLAGPVPVGRWVGYTACLVVINLAVLALHIVLSARLDNQVLCLGTGVVGIFLAYFGAALPAGVRHLFPWGYYSLATPADFAGEQLVYFDLPYRSIAGLALGAGALFWFITRHFDRQER